MLGKVLRITVWEVGVWKINRREQRPSNNEDNSGCHLGCIRSACVMLLNYVILSDPCTNI